MKIVKQVNAFCPKCNKHTPHTVKLYAKGPMRGTDTGNRRRRRKLKGYVGKVKGQATVKKLAKRQKVLLICKECKYTVERVIGSRTKKRLEFNVETA
jgi:large subunit ribosomal protein L44e